MSIIERAALFASLLLALALPFWLSGFTVFQLTLAGIYAIAILGLNLLTGISGQFSLGHSAFYALGAYSAAILIDREIISVYWTIPCAGLICFGAGVLFGLPALRLEGLYLALATFALAVATPQILKSSHLEPLTGGVQGISLLKPEPPLPLSIDQWWYLLTLILLLLLCWLARNLLLSRSGRALIALRDNPIAAQAMGVNTALYKTLIFGVSAFYTGIAGALAAIVVEFVAPDSFTFSLSILFLIGLIIGGLGSIPGAIIGGLFILFVPNLAEQISQALAGAMFGILLIIMIYIMPGGAAGLARALCNRLGKRFIPITNK